MDVPSHLGLLFQGPETTTLLWDPENKRELRVTRRDVGAGDFRDVTAGDPLEGDMSGVPWPEGHAPDATNATVRTVVADLGGGETRVHALALCFGSAAVAAWEKVPLTVGATVGTCGFASGRFVKRQRDEHHLHEVIVGYEEDDTHDLGCVLEFEDGPVAIASSGYGDGSYALWWGRAEDGAVACLAYDFEVLCANTFHEIALPLPLTRAQLKAAPLGSLCLRVPWLRGTSKPTLDSAALPEHQWAYARVRRADGKLRAPTHRATGAQRVQLDLSPFGEGDVLLVRHVTGSAPMPMAE